MFINRIIQMLYSESCRKRFRSSQPDLRFHPRDSVFSYRNIDLGKRVFINSRAFFTAPAGEIVIGNNVLFGTDVMLAAGSHCYSKVGALIQDQGYNGGDREKRILIDDDVWIAGKACVLGNAHVHEGTVIGAASIVLTDMPPYCLCAGSPCKPVKLRYSDAELREHYHLLGKTAEAAERMIEIRRDMLNDMELERLYG